MLQKKLVESLVDNIAVLALAAEIISRLRPMQIILLNEKRKLRDDFILALIFGGLIVISTLLSIHVGSYNLSSRMISAMAAGLLGGPLVGFEASIMGSLFVLVFSSSKVYAQGAAFSTMLFGLLGAGFYPYFQRGKWKYRDLFLLACFAELTEIIALLRMTISLEITIDEVLVSAGPMILLNAVGILIFIACFNTVFIGQDLESSRQLQRMLDLTRRMMPLVEDSFANQENMEKLVSMLGEEMAWPAVMITDTNHVLAWKISGDEDLTSPVEYSQELKHLWEKHNIPEDSWHASAALRTFAIKKGEGLSSALRQEPVHDRIKDIIKEQLSDNKQEMEAISLLMEIPKTAERAIQTGTMVAGEELSSECIWYHTMKPYSVVAAPFIIEGKAAGCLVVCVKKQWVERTSENQLIQDLVTIGSYQMASRELERRKTMLQQAEFKALQFQVNPHFLFNALNTISSVCREDPEEARELLVTLADYFRYNLDYESYLVPLSEELEHVKDYLSIERARFEDKLIVEIDAPERMDIRIPTLILQPIVENAIRHGISPDGHRYVRISILEEADAYTVTVSDKGRGFSTEVLRKLYEGEAIGNRVGLSNVHMRLQNIYGEENGLKIDSTEEGSRVQMRFYKAESDG